MGNAEYMGSVSLAVALPGHRNETMSLDSYTQNIPLTQKARFWSNYVSALKGSQDLRAPEEAVPRTWHPSIIETLPNDFPDLKHEFGKLESHVRPSSQTWSRPSLSRTARCTRQNLQPWIFLLSSSY